MKKGVSRTNMNVYNKMDKNDISVYMPKSKPTVYVDAHKLALSNHKISEESMKKDINEILEKAAHFGEKMDSE